MSGRYVVPLDDAADESVLEVGGKASTLARLAARGLPVPPGFVVTASASGLPAAELAAQVGAALRSAALAHADAFAVRSSAIAEDLPEASFAGLYETYLDVPGRDVAAAVGRCRDAASSGRVSAYSAGRSVGAGTVDRIAVLVQPMVTAEAAGVAFTANPLTGDRSETIVSAVRGLGERLVGGTTAGDEWRVVGRRATSLRSRERAIGRRDARAIASLARRVEREFGAPQDIEWAISGRGPARRLHLLQARPMTALPPDGTWRPPGPGLWSRNFRLGEWLSDPMTPLFADWLVPRMESGFDDAMRHTIGAVLPFRTAAVNGWYFTAAPAPKPAHIWRALVETRGRIVPTLYAVLIQVSRDPAAADCAVLDSLLRRWRQDEVPAFERAIAEAAAGIADAAVDDVARIVDALGAAAGRQAWYLAILGGSTWKMEAALTAFARRHLPGLFAAGAPLADGVQVLLRALPELERLPAGPLVQSLDWFWPIDDRLDVPAPAARREVLCDQRRDAEAACLAELSASPALRRRFIRMLEVVRRYTVVREQQAQVLPAAWPALRACALRIGERLMDAGVLSDPEQVFFLTRAELAGSGELAALAEERRERWEQDRARPAPLVIGRAPRLIGDPIGRAVERARGDRRLPANALIGEPASAGRASGSVNVVEDPSDVASFRVGDVLVARTTAPAWTPLFARAAAVVTDSGSLAAHASIVAREYGIPAVVGTGDATTRLRTGQYVTVDGTAGVVELGP